MKHYLFIVLFFSTYFFSQNIQEKSSNEHQLKDGYKYTNIDFRSDPSFSIEELYQGEKLTYIKFLVFFSRGAIYTSEDKQLYILDLDSGKKYFPKDYHNTPVNQTITDDVFYFCVGFDKLPASAKNIEIIEGDYKLNLGNWFIHHISFDNAISTQINNYILDYNEINNPKINKLNFRKIISEYSDSNANIWYKNITNLPETDRNFLSQKMNETLEEEKFRIKIYYDEVRKQKLLGKLNGKYYYDSDNISYEGEFSNGKMNGIGIIKNKEIGYSYTGNFKNDLPDGNGKWEKTDGSWYEGQFKNGVENGMGTLRQSNGLRYTGNFTNGLPNGKFKIVRWTLMGLAKDEWDATFENGKLISSSQTESGMTDFLSGKSAREAQATQKALNCSNCEIDKTKTKFPSNGENLLYTYRKPGKIYMINGNTYDFYYSSDKKSWLVETGIFSFNEKFTNFEDMLNYFLEECKKEYCK